MPTPLPPDSLALLQAAFLTVVLPRVLSHGDVFFRHIKCPHRKEDAVQEMVALCWKWHVRLAERGKDATQFPCALASFAARAVRNGRRLAGTERDRDALCRLAQTRRCFVVATLPEFSTLSTNPLAEALHDNTVSPVPEQVCFRLDFPAWLSSLGDRNRSMAQAMALGHRTQDLADAYHISQARVSQLRGQLCRSWRRFTGESTSPGG